MPSGEHGKKVFGQWVHIIRAARMASTPEHALFSVRQIIIIFTMGNDSLVEEVMTDWSLKDRGCAVEESSNLVLASVRGDDTCLECRQVSHELLFKALNGGAGVAHRWCAKKDALSNLSLLIKTRQGESSAEPQVHAPHYATG